MSSFVRKLSMNFASRKESTLTDPRADFLVDSFYSGQTVHAGHSGQVLAERLRSVLETEESPEGADQSHRLFCEMLCLQKKDDMRYVWEEKSRWIKYEETVEEGGARWSKPHITLLSMESCLQLKACFKKAAVSLDADIATFQDVIKFTLDIWSRQYDMLRQEIPHCKRALSSKKQHLGKTKTEEDVDEQKSGSSHPEGEMDEGGGYKVKAKDHNLLRKIGKDAEGACIMVGYVSSLFRPMSHFIRLKTAQQMPELLEVAIPVRFIFILLLPLTHAEKDAHLVGATLGILFADEVFSEVCYKAHENTDLICGVDEFLCQSLMIPAGKWSPKDRLEPSENSAVVVRTIGKLAREPFGSMDIVQEQKLRRTGKIFGGLMEDLRVKASWYRSDFVDAFKGRISQIIAASIFLFFANVSKIVTFGGVMDHILNKQMGTIENLVAGASCGILYALFSGQPLCILSATGPCLVFETIIFQLCESEGWEFLVLRFWVGMWTAVFILILVAMDASVMVAWITRFTEEAFATLISLIYIIKAVQELVMIASESPMGLNVYEVLHDPCICNLTNGSDFGFYHVYLPPSEPSNLTNEDCLRMGGILHGLQCHFKPDVFLFSIILFFATFFITYGLKTFRFSNFLSSKLRNAVADFNVTIAIVVLTLINWLVGLEVPTLHVPEKFQPTTPRNWFVDPLQVHPWWLIFVSMLPAVFFSILITMDQNITSVIINRKDNKIQKGYGYHLDLAVIAMLIVICSSLGIPFYVAATVVSLMHVHSLKMMSETAAPGEKPEFLGIREQRITALTAHILVALSLFITPAMRLIPVPVLLGIFLYMGIVSLHGQQFIDRLLIVFMPAKYQPDKPWLRRVRIKRVHLFTFIQLAAFIVLTVVEEIKTVSMAFPLMLIVMVFTRKLFMEKVFSTKELKALDDLLPPWREMIRPSNQPLQQVTPRNDEEKNEQRIELISRSFHC